jgi:hypothetical protein
VTSKNDNLFFIILLLGFLVAFSIYALLNYDCNIASDVNTYLDFGRSIARGNYYVDFPPERVLFEHLPREDYHRGFYTRYIRNNRSFPFVAIGYPFFLAVFIIIGGIYAPMLANSFIYILMFVFLYYLTNHLFIGYRYRRYVSLASVFTLFIATKAGLFTIGPDSTKSFLQCFRDPFSFLLLLIAYFFFFRFLNHARRRVDIALSAVFFGVACCVRETAVLGLLPAMLLYLVDVLKRRCLPSLKEGVCFVLFFILGCSPLLLQNYVNTGNSFYPTQSMGRIGLATTNSQKETPGILKVTAPGAKFQYFPGTCAKYLRRLYSYYGPVGCLLFALGIFFGRKQTNLIFFIIPFIFVYFVYYGLIRVAHWRYIAVLHMLIAPVIAFGFISLLGMIKFKDLYLKITLSILFGIVLFGMFHSTPESLFQIKHAKIFKSDLETVVPADSVIIAERRMRSIINYFTSSYCFRFDDFVRPKNEVTIEKGLRYYFENYDNIYFFDSYDLNAGLQHLFNYTPVNTQKILDSYNMVAIKVFDGEKYNLADHFGQESCTLFRLEKWSANSSSHIVETGGIEDSILMINARRLWNNRFDRSYAELYCNGHLISSSIGDGINFVFVAEEFLKSPRSVIELRSDAPVPAELEPDLFGIYDPITLDVGADAVPMDDTFMANITPGFGCRYRMITRETSIRIPTISYPKSVLGVAVKARLSRKAPSNGVLTASIDGKVVSSSKITKSSNPKYLGFLINDQDVERNPAQLSFEIEPVCNAGEQAPDPTALDGFVDMDRIVIHRVDISRQRLLIDVGTSDELFIKSGLYGAEKHLGEHSARWTRPIAEFRLPELPLKNEYILQVEAFGGPEAAGEKVSEIFINDTKIGEMTIVPESAQAFSFNVPPEALSTGSNVLTFKTPRWRPSDISRSSDRRELGIMLDSIELDWSD